MADACAPAGAPEILQGLRYNSAVDIYSFAVTLLEFIIGSFKDGNYVKNAFRGHGRDAVKEGWRPAIPPLEDLPEGDKETFPPEEYAALRQLVKECWLAEPSGRPKADELLQKLLQISTHAEPEGDELAPT